MCTSLGKHIHFFHSCWYKPRKGIVGSYGKQTFNFRRNSQTVFHHGVLFWFPISSAWKCQYFHFFITPVLVCSLMTSLWCDLCAYLPSVYLYLLNFLFKYFVHFFALVPFIHFVRYLRFSYFNVTVIFYFNFQFSVLYRKAITSILYIICISCNIA